MIFAFSADKKMFLFINHILPVVFSHLKIGDKLNGVSRTSFFAKAAENASRKIDPEEFRVSSAIFVFCCLKRNTIYRTCCCTEITGDTSFVLLCIARKDNPPPVTWSKIWPDLRVFHSFCFVKDVKKS